MSRAEVFDPNEVAIGHFYSRTVRRCFLMSEDPVSGIGTVESGTSPLRILFQDGSLMDFSRSNWMNQNSFLQCLQKRQVCS
jgi:hypothetical protein